MAWVKIDDHFDEHPKIAQLGDSAFALFVCGLAYCNRNLTDGFIPSQVGLGQLRFCDGNTVPPIRELEAAGMWEKVAGGWRVHDFADYQPSKDAVLKDRQRSAERTARWRQERRNAVSDAPGDGVTSIVSTPVTNGVSTPVSDGVSTPVVTMAPYPVPVPGPGPGTRGPDPETSLASLSLGSGLSARASPAQPSPGETDGQAIQDELCTEFAPQLGGESYVRAALARAAGYGRTAPAALRDWLTKDVQRYAAAHRDGRAAHGAQRGARATARPVEPGSWGLDAFPAG